MLITEAMERYYADLLERNVISMERLLIFIQEREDCTLEEAKEMEYCVLCFLGMAL